MTSIGFSTPKRFNPVSWLVRKLTGSVASHTWFLVFDATLGMQMVLEAHELGFRALPYSRFKRDNNVVAVLEPKCDLAPGLRFAARWIGTAYDFGGLLGMAWVLLGRVFGRRWHNPTQNSHSMFCSEMAVTVLQHVGFPGAQDMVPADTSPQDLLDFLSESSDVLKPKPG